ncbi:MAG: hypothetical protein H8D87_09410 [Deltaproteobacteria bacterium]|uniref:hypothetical protein n=1 Tax=Desulfobacula sp. TaxID=2593537 RepID=UPI0019A8AFD5|nr:hypothetical protein [Candidatus Desulfobacula maris]MBL6994362.1 hypothetical protein [Desulfobacula sp.]
MLKNEKKYKKDVQIPTFYFALKSQNEIYFQMASIFKEVGSNENKLAKKFFNEILMDDSSMIFLEKSF